MTDNIIPFDPSITETTPSTKDQDGIAIMCDSTYNQVTTARVRISRVVEQIQAIDHAMSVIEKDLDRDDVTAEQIEQHQRDLIMVDEWVRGFESALVQ